MKTLLPKTDCSVLLVSAGRVSGHHLLHPVCSGDRPFPRRHLLVPAEGPAGGALPLGAAEAAAGVARRSAAFQPRNLPVAAEPGRVPVHRPAGRLLHHHALLPAVPLPARLPPLSAAQVSPGEYRTGPTGVQNVKVGCRSNIMHAESELLPLSSLKGATSDPSYYISRSCLNISAS